MNPRTSHLFFGFSGVLTLGFLAWNSPFLHREAAFMLILFNAFFVSLIFPLDGALLGKLGLLLTGNVIGWSWNFATSILERAAAESFGTRLDLVLTFVNPFVNLIWIIPFWSVSLTLLVRSRRLEERL